MNTFYTWKLYSDINWNNFGNYCTYSGVNGMDQGNSIPADMTVKRKLSGQWRNIGENRKSDVSQVFFICT